MSDPIYEAQAYEIAKMARSISTLEAENAKLRELVVRMRPICIEGKRCTFADRVYIDSTMEELRIEVKDD